jgi:hypothetical protein
VPPYGQQPAYWPNYPPTRPRRRWLVWVIVAGALTLGGCGAVVATFGVRVYHQMDDAKAAVNDFLTAIEAGDEPTAQGLLCDEAAPDAVQRSFGSGVVHHQVVSVFVRSTHGFGSDQSRRTSADVTVDVLLRNGASHRDVVDVEKEHGRWLVCGVTRSQIR